MTTTFSVTRDDIINSALRLQGWLDYQATADATKITHMAQALNIMIKAWSSREIKLWCVEELILPLVNGQRSYTIGPTGTPDLTANRPLRIIEAFMRYNPSGAFNDVSLQPLSRNEYQMLGNKATSGTPNSYYYDAQIPLGVVYVYVAPDSVGATREIHLFSQRLVQDISSAGATFDFPQEWYQALRWGLAAETALENQVPLEVADRIEAKAGQFLEAIQNWDRENTSVFFQPDMLRMAGRGRE